MGPHGDQSTTTTPFFPKKAGGFCVLLTPRAVAGRACHALLRLRGRGSRSKAQQGHRATNAPSITHGAKNLGRQLVGLAL